MRSRVYRSLLAPIWLMLAMVLFTAGTSPAVVSADEAPVPYRSFLTWFRVEQPPTLPFEVVQIVVDFPAGSRVARHTHGGPGYITLLDRELTMWIGDAPVRTYQSGESFVEPFGLIAEGANLGAEPSSVLVSYLLPVGAPVTTVVQNGATPPSAPAGSRLPPGASPRFESRLRIERAPDRYRLGQSLRVYPPGAWGWSFEPTTHALLTVMEGEVTVLVGAGERTVHVGEQWEEVPGQAILVGNASDRQAVAAWSIISQAEY